jgi:hypothetical protein
VYNKFFLPINNKEFTMLKSFFKRGNAQWLLPLATIMILLGSQVVAEAEEKHQTFSFRLLLSEKKCQMAIWLTDEKGVFVDTVYVTKKVAKKGLGNRSGKLDDKWGGPRLSALPVWAYSRGIDYGKGNFYPPKNKPLPDAITSATPKAGEFVWEWKPKKALKPGKYFYYIEVNKSFDKDEHHEYSWYRGQPSVVWQGSIQTENQTSRSEAKIIGHGHVAGEDGKINPDLSTLTTSLRLIEKFEVVYHP